MHEIITIQIGREANYLATHFWNAQETYQTFAPEPASPVNHDVHFRQGWARDGTETYLPRTLIYDLKGEFGSLAKVNALGAALDADAEQEASVWNGPLAKLPSLPQPQISPYANSLLASSTPVAPTSATTAYFSDFAATYFHPRSLLPLAPPHPTLSAAATGTSPSAAAPTPQFTSFAHGASLFAARDASDEVLDSDFRPWLEECDALQGLQILTELSSAWSGFAARYVDALRDELPKLPLWVWAIDANSPLRAQPLHRRREAAVNRAQAVASLSASASVLVPMSAPDILPRKMHGGQSLWERSALLEAALESFTLPSRLRAGESGRVPVLGDWEAALGDNGRRRVMNLKMGIGEAPETKEDDRVRGGRAGGEDTDPDWVQDALDASLDVDFFPHGAAAAGTPGARVLGRKRKAFARIEAFRSSSDSHQDLSAFGQRGSAGRSVVEWQVHRSPQAAPLMQSSFAARPGLPQPVTFPRMFAGFAGAVPVHTSLSTSPDIASWFRGLAAPFGPASSSVALPGELDGEEKEALRSALLEAADVYVEDWESESEGEAEE